MAVTQDPAHSGRYWCNYWHRDGRYVSCLKSLSPHNIAQRMYSEGWLLWRVCIRSFIQTWRLSWEEWEAAVGAPNFPRGQWLEGIVLLSAYFCRHFPLASNPLPPLPAVQEPSPQVSCCLYRLEKEPWQQYSAPHCRMFWLLGSSGDLMLFDLPEVMHEGSEFSHREWIRLVSQLFQSHFIPPAGHLWSLAWFSAEQRSPAHH